MALRIRKLIVLGMFGGVLLLANALVLANWLDELGVIDWASWLRAEFLTGTAITIILALLILLVSHDRRPGIDYFTRRHCPVCDRALTHRGKYCPGCGSLV